MNPANSPTTAMQVIYCCRNNVAEHWDTERTFLLQLHIAVCLLLIVNAVCPKRYNPKKTT